MNGITSAAGLLLLACGAGPRESADQGQAHYPGTGGTILFILADADVDLEQVAGRRGPEVRLKFAGRVVQAPVLRIFCRGSLFDAYCTPTGAATRHYSKPMAAALIRDAPP